MERLGRRRGSCARPRRLPPPSRRRRRRSTRSSTRSTATSAMRSASARRQRRKSRPHGRARYRTDPAERLDRVVTMLGLRLDEARSLARRRRPRVGAATRCAWGRGASAGCRMSHASSASSRARNGTSSSCASRSSSTGCACSKTATSPVTDAAATAASHGTRMGRAPVRSRLLHRTRDLDVRRS